MNAEAAEEYEDLVPAYPERKDHNYYLASEWTQAGEIV